MRKGLFGFLLGMWILIILGGGIVVLTVGPISITGFGDMDWFLSSTVKAFIALILVAAWILILSKLKNWIFKKEIQS